MSVILVTMVDVLDAQRYGDYMASAPALDRWGGEVLAYDTAPAVIEGSFGRQRLALVRFPSREKLDEFYNFPEYQAARRRRVDGGAVVDLVVVQELPGGDG